MTMSPTAGLAAYATSRDRAVAGVTAVAAGNVLSVAGQVIAFIPNEIGAALLHNERVTR